MRHAKSIQTKSRKHQIEQTGPATFTVKSGASGNLYNVSLNGIARCSCDWGKYRPAGQTCGCSHVVSVYDYLSSQAGYKVMAWGSEEEARRQHRQIINLGDGLTLTTRRI